MIWRIILIIGIDLKEYVSHEWIRHTPSTLIHPIASHHHTSSNNLLCACTFPRHRNQTLARLPTNQKSTHKVKFTHTMNQLTAVYASTKQQNHKETNSQFIHWQKPRKHVRIRKSINQRGKQERKEWGCKEGWEDERVDELQSASRCFDWLLPRGWARQLRPPGSSACWSWLTPPPSIAYSPQAPRRSVSTYACMYVLYCMYVCM